MNPEPLPPYTGEKRRPGEPYSDEEWIYVLRHYPTHGYRAVGEQVGRSWRALTVHLSKLRRTRPDFVQQHLGAQARVQRSGMDGRRWAALRRELRLTPTHLERLLGRSRKTLEAYERYRPGIARQAVGAVSIPQEHADWLMMAVQSQRRVFKEAPVLQPARSPASRKAREAREAKESLEMGAQ